MIDSVKNTIILVELFNKTSEFACYGNADSRAEKTDHCVTLHVQYGANLDAF